MKKNWLLLVLLALSLLMNHFVFSQSEVVFEKHILAENARNIEAVKAGDIDQDGDNDLLLSTKRLFYWLENDGKNNFQPHPIEEYVENPGYSFIIDLDGDGDIDLLLIARNDNFIGWYENDGRQNFTLHTIDVNFFLPTDIHAVDLDRDGDFDILGTAWQEGEIAWWENIGEQQFKKRTIGFGKNYQCSLSIYPGDLDNDGDIDLVTSGADNNERIDWWENDGQQNFTKHNINRTKSGNQLVVIDMDQDGNLDILHSDSQTSTVVWWKNDGFGNFQEKIIDPSFKDVIGTNTADFDGDGDLDVVCSSFTTQIIRWWENDGQANFTQHLVDNALDGSQRIQIFDFDNDGDPDFITNARNQDQALWYENLGSPEPVVFNDPNLERVVRAALNKPTGVITNVDMAKLKVLKVINENINDLTGLEYAVNLDTLDLSSNKISDLTPLQNLIKLATLILFNNELDNNDLPMLYQLDNLTSLNLCLNLGITSGTAMQTLGENLDKMNCEDIEWDGTCGVDPNKAPVAQITKMSADTLAVGDSLFVHCTASDSDGHRVQMKVYWGDNIMSNYSAPVKSDSTLIFSHVYQTIGSHYVKARAIDEEGLEGEWSDKHPIEVIVGNSAPTASIVSVSADTVFTGKTLIIRCKASDPQKDRVQLKINWGDGIVTDYGSLVKSDSVVSFGHLYDAAGDYGIKIIAADEHGLEGNWSPLKKITVIFENTAPTAQIVNQIPATLGIGDSVVIDCKGYDNENNRVQLRVDWGDSVVTDYTRLFNSEATVQFIHAYQKTGTYIIRAMAKDEHGAEGQWSAGDTITVVAGNTAPTATIIWLSADTTTIGDTLLVHCAAADSEKHPVQLKMEWGDGTVTTYSQPVVSDSTLTFEHTYFNVGEYEIKVRAKDSQGLEGNWSGPVTIHVVEKSSAINSETKAVYQFALCQNYPNPFNNTTRIRYSLNETIYTEIAIFDATAKLVKTLVAEIKSRGEHEVYWDGTDVTGKPVASGSYYYKLSAGEHSITNRMVFLK